MNKKPLVIIESPFAGQHLRNNIYLARAIHDCFERGEIPFASHGFYTRYLDDSKEEERNQGIEASHEIMLRAEYVVVYADYGLSDGMLKGIQAAKEAEKPIKMRSIGYNK
jgi:hypothetical protein